MRCHHCKKKLRDGQFVLPILQVVGNHKPGDFVGSPEAYIHITCIERRYYDH